MNDASNIIITNNPNNITRVKFGKLNNKKSSTNDKLNIVPKINNSNSNNKDIQIKNKLSTQKSNNRNSNNNANINGNNNNNNKLDQQNMNVSQCFIEKNYFFTLLYRCFPTKIKIFTLIFFLISSTVFLGINLFDYINFWKNNKLYISELWLINNIVVFTLQIIFSFGILFFQCIMYIINQGEYQNFTITSIIFIIVFSSLRIFIFVKHTNLSLSILIDLIYSIFIFLINIVFLMLIMLTNKKKKNVLQNIDEIVNFTENNMQTQKKEKEMNMNTLNNSPNLNILKKEIKSVQLVEEDKETKKNGT
jgi:hypothetical protein